MVSEFEKHVISQTPLARFGQPEDIAPVAVSCRLKRHTGSQCGWPILAPFAKVGPAGCPGSFFGTWVLG